MRHPETIFKYVGANIRSIVNIKSQSFYMAPINKLNDPYDSSVSFILNDLSDDEIKTLKSQKDCPEELVEESYFNVRKKTKEICEKLLLKHQSEFVKTRGVTCFSERNDNLLMWAHYADGYKGMCLEFDTNYSPFEKLHKVRYGLGFPLIDVATCLDLKEKKERDSLIKDLYCHKSNDWSYEKEWRLIHEKAGTEFVYESEALKAIYFGPEIEQEILETTCLIIQGQNPQVEFWKGCLSENEFKVIFSRFRYHSFNEVKSKGLEV